VPLFFCQATGNMTTENCLLARFRTLLALFISCMSPLVFSTSAKDVASRTVSCGKYEYHYLLYTSKRSGPLPAILILHGAGDQPEPMVEAWKSLAKKEGIVLIAPQLPRVAAFEEVAPQVFRSMVEDAKKDVLLDPQRIYVFGNSMGGYLGYDAACCNQNTSPPPLSMQWEFPKTTTGSSLEPSEKVQWPSMLATVNALICTIEPAKRATCCEKKISLSITWNSETTTTTTTHSRTTSTQTHGIF
jgi:acetyl esterase/lipase